MKKLFYFLVFFLCLILIGCSKKEIENKQIADHLNKLKAEAVFSLDTIISTPFDSLYIVKPYVQMDLTLSLNRTDIPGELINALENNVYQDSYCILLLFKDGRIIRYEKIPRNVADFSFLRDDVFKYGQSFMLDSTRAVYSIVE